jgi:hypothetical protein
VDFIECGESRRVEIERVANNMGLYEGIIPQPGTQPQTTRYIEQKYY